MKKFPFIPVASLLVISMLSGCKTLQVGDSAMADAKISPMQTFAVGPVEGYLDRMIALDVDRVRLITRETIVNKLQSKGYRLASDGMTPEFTVYPQWMITTQNNPDYELNSGNVFTAQQVPTVRRAATLNISVKDDQTGDFIWRNSSPWPFSPEYGTITDLQNSVSWTLDSFPVQQAQLGNTDN